VKVSLKTKLVASAAAGLALATLAAGPAMADSTGDTDTSFTLTGAGLEVSVPSAATISASTFIGITSLSGQLGDVTVTDDRGGLLHSVTATVSATDFTTGTAGDHEVITKDKVTYSSGLASDSTGVGLGVPSGIVTLGSSQTAFSWTGVVGSQSATWDPTITVDVPVDVVAGTYTGTITHSVA
jgi:hypothetical protein